MTLPLHPYNGWVILDKPLNISSSTAVQKVRHCFGKVKAGHGGTLDPLATGILPIALGEATKLIPFIMDKEKTYDFTVRWGAQTTTDDLEGEIMATSPHRPDGDSIVKALPSFIGNIWQSPPAYSAIKVAGERAYAQARRGENVVIPKRQVHVRSLELMDCRNPSETCFRLTCGKGTYVRSLARDLALFLETVGHVSALKRIRVGPFSITESITLEKMLELRHGSGLKEIIHPLSMVLDDIPVVVLGPDDLNRLQRGQMIKCPESITACQWFVACHDYKNDLRLMARIENDFLKPVRVFNI